MHRKPFNLILFGVTHFFLLCFPFSEVRATFSWQATATGVSVTVEEEDDDDYSAEEADVAMDSSGNALLVWQQPDTNDSRRIYLSQYTSGIWSTPSAIDGGSYHASSPQVVLNEKGDVGLVVWIQPDQDSYDRLYAATYSSSGISSPNTLEDNSSGDPADVHDLDVAMNASGDGVVVWSRDDNSGYRRIYAKRYLGATNEGWAAQEALDGGDYDAKEPQVTFDSSGNAVTVWEQKDSTGYTRIYASYYTASAFLWSAPETLDGGSFSADGPQVTMDDSGNATAIWEQEDATGLDRLYVSRYISGVWSSPTALDEGLEGINSPAVTTNSSGDVMVAWRQTVSSVERVYVSRYSSSTWTSPATVDEGTYNAGNPKLAMDSSGNTLVIWDGEGGSGYQRIYVSRYDLDLSTWSSTPQTLDDGGYSVENPRVTMNGSGDAMVVWDQLDATSGSNMRVYVQVGDYEIVCGDDTVDETESCDDGNTTDGDGCSAACATEVEQVCNNTVDDDGNGLTDCDDNGCATSLDCVDSNSDTTSDPAATPATLDSDGDGVSDLDDVFPQDATESVDADQDGIGDNADTDDGSVPILLDSDGDGVDDTQDAFPSDASETLDSDGDGIGNTADSDDDNDGVSDGVDGDDDDDDIPDTEDADADSDADGSVDAQDAFPLDATETTDTDGDGAGDNIDTDDDNDGVDDAENTDDDDNNLDDSDESASAGTDASAVSTGCGCSFSSYNPKTAHQNSAMGFVILLIAWVLIRLRLKMTKLPH